MNKSNCETCRSFLSVTTTSLEVEHNQITIETVCCACHIKTTTKYETKVIFSQTLTKPKGAFVLPTPPNPPRNVIGFIPLPLEERFADDEHHPNEHH